ncbi:MAG: DUF2059 domain-containing protein [Rhodoferax sp.]|nr:DUF2059 domain-containing protein [Pseudorhodobacter sp.]
MNVLSLFGLLFFAVSAGPSLADRSISGGGDGMVFLSQATATTDHAERILRLSSTLQITGVLSVMQAEGVDYGKTLEAEMFPGKGGAAWDAIVAGIYDTSEMKSLFDKALIAELSVADLKTLDVIEAFFASDRGQRILLLEIEARRALLDKDIENAAKLHVEDLAAMGDPRLDVIREFAQTNDLIEMNVAGALNANLAFFKGMAAAGGLQDGMTEDEMLQNVWSQEPAIRTETETWLYPYLALAYQPLSDDDMQAYISFSELKEGKALNAAVFAGFNLLFTDISDQLGRAAAKQMHGEDI